MNFDQILEIIERIKHADAAEEILIELKSTYNTFGFENFIISGLPHSGLNLAPFVLLESWPVEWFDRYVAKDYVHKDPIAKHCFTTNDPFLWDEVATGTSINKHEALVMNEATEFDLRNGFCIPIHMENGTQGCISLSGDRKNIPESDRALLHMLSFFAHGRLRYLKENKKNVPLATLTARQKEVIQWTILGKTSEQIGEILSISPRTVEFHFANAGEKLGSGNRIQTVVEAIKTKQVTL